LKKQQGGQQFHLVEPPSLPALPSSPNRLKLGLGAVGAGLLLGLAGAVLRELVAPAFYQASEITGRFAAPLVIAVPLVRTRSEARRRGWAKVFEAFAGSVVIVAICAAEFYVLRHP
jgi:hypothetical protein